MVVTDLEGVSGPVDRGPWATAPAGHHGLVRVSLVGDRSGVPWTVHAWAPAGPPIPAGSRQETVGIITPTSPRARWASATERSESNW